MSPSPVHEHAVKYFTDCIRAFVAPYESRRMQVSHLPNSGIAGEEDGRDVIPDVRLDLEPRYGTYGTAVTVWVGECGYSQSRQAILRKLDRAVRNSPSINAAFVILVRNSRQGKRPLPGKHPLLSQPALTPSAFSGPLITPVTALTDVKVGNIVWISIQSVEFFVFTRGKDGNFNFNVSGENPHAARGQLHPQIEMENLTQLLNAASRRLLITIADIMEAHDDEDHANLREAAETATFPVDWNFFLEHLQSSLYQTAFGRYKKWHHKGQKDLTAGSTRRLVRRRK